MKILDRELDIQKTPEIKILKYLHLQFRDCIVFLHYSNKTGGNIFLSIIIKL